MTLQPPSQVSELARLSKRVAALERLLEVAQVLAAENDVVKVLAAIACEACRAMHCERATVYEYDAKREELFSRVATELEVEEIRRPLARGISGYVARTRQTLNVPDPARDARWDSALDEATGYTTRNIVATPLVSPRDGSLLGVLQLLNNAGGPFDADDEELMVAFAQHAAVALDRARLTAEARGRQQTEASLAVAREVQRSFMPREVAPIPGYQAAAWWYPHEAVGGDYCDVLPMKGNRFGLCIADVSGHGLGPSLTMASVRASLRTLLWHYDSPAEVVRQLARTMYGDLHERWFITLLFAVLDPASHRLSYANAGHGPALHFSLREEMFHELKATGMPLGILEETPFEEVPPLEMQAGDLIVLCTDGIVEAMDHRGKPFGVQRLEDLVRRLALAPLPELVATLGGEVERHYVGQSPPDDLTILALRRTAPLL